MFGPGRTDRPWELYNLKQDPGETADLAGSRPDKLAELDREFDAQAADARAQAAGALPDPMFEVELEGIDFERPRALPGIEPDGKLIWNYFEAM